MTYERFAEYVSETMDRHISRDKDTVPDDQKWETDEFINRLAFLLRLEGLGIDQPEPFPKNVDLSQFEGM